MLKFSKYIHLSLSALILSSPVFANTDEDIAVYQSSLQATLKSEGFSDVKFTKGTVETSAGKITFIQSKGTSKNPLVFIHGNSASGASFLKQFKELGDTHTLVAFDLPGHGESDNAKNPKETYTFNGYANIISEALSILEIESPIIVGWSLGGHIGLDLAVNHPNQVAGLVITGAPPIEHSMKGVGAGFNLSAAKNAENLIAYEGQLTLQQATAFMKDGGIETGPIDFIHRSAVRTHGLARSTMIAAIVDGSGLKDESAVLPTLPTPLGIIINEKEVAINNPYIRSLAYNPNTFMGFESIDSGHASFWEKPSEFNTALKKYISKIVK